MRKRVERARSDLMSRIRGRGNASTEQMLCTWFRRHGVRGWRRHQIIRISGAPRSFDGTTFRPYTHPDFVFRKERLAVFVDGCFWHGCAKHSSAPRTNKRYWNPKIAMNKARDRANDRSLRRQGWKVLRLWEHQLTMNGEKAVIDLVEDALVKR